MKKIVTPLFIVVSYILHWTLRVNPQKVWVSSISLSNVLVLLLGTI